MLAILFQKVWFFEVSDQRVSNLHFCGTASISAFL